MAISPDSAEQGSCTSLDVETIKRYADGLRRFIYAKSRDPQDVDDVAQEVWKRFLEIDTEEAIREPLALLFTIAKSVLVDRERRASTHRCHTREATDADMHVPSEKLTRSN